MITLAIQLLQSWLPQRIHNYEQYAVMIAIAKQHKYSILSLAVQHKYSCCKKWVIMISTCVLLKNMIIISYSIPTLGILRLPNIASKHDPHSLLHVHRFLPPKDTHLTLPVSATRVTILSSIWACIFIPWTLICSGPFQQLKVTILGSTGACIFIPWALIRPGPFQHVKVAIQGSIGACPFIPRALICSGPFQQLKVTIFGSIGAHPFITWTLICPGPL